MNERAENKIRNKRVMIVLMEYIVTLGCLLVAFVMVSGKKIEQTSSYAKPEKVSRYQVVDDEYITRVRPLTEYSTFKEIAENSLNKNVIVYKDATKTEEVEEEYIASGMVVQTENASYEVRVVGDLNNDGDSNVIELTKIIREVVGLERIESKGELISADYNGDGEINVVDITMCIRYIVYGELPADKEEPNAPEINVIEPEERENNWYNSDVRVEIVEKERKEGEIEKTKTVIEKQLVGSKEVEKETTREKEIELTEEGEYKITSQSYGVNGLKSEVVTKEINIDKTTPILSVSKEDIEGDITQCKIKIIARDEGGIRKYSVAREGEEERSREGIDEKEINGHVTIRENGKYKVTVEDKAGNKAEEEIEITDLNNRYTIRFLNEDGESVLIEKTCAEGENIGETQIPTKAEDERNTYEFAGWKTTNEEGQEITVTSEEIANEIVTGDKDYTATYSATPKIYKVIFKDGESIIPTKTNYNYGDIIEETEVPENPSKAEDERYTYEFKGWKIINDEGQEEVVTREEIVNSTVEENKQYIAEYEATEKKYTVIFKDYNDNELLRIENYNYESKLVVPPSPTRVEDEMYTYEFVGWETTNEEEGIITVQPEDMTNITVTENKEYKATYNATPRIYTVIFKDGDGNEIDYKKEYTYEEQVQIPEIPTKAEDETFTYEFKGWSPEVQEIVTENKEYTATYESKYKEYTVTFKQDSGEVLSNLGHHYGDKVRLPEDPHKLSTMEYAYRFTGWSKVEEGEEIAQTKEEIENTDVTKELEYVATYEAAKINYNLVFYNDDYNEETGEGTVIERRTYNYGDIINFPEAIKEDTEEIKYIFDSWKNLGTRERAATEIDIEFKAEYREEYYVARLEPIVQTVSTTNEETGETTTEEQVILEGKSYLTIKEAIEEAGRVERTIRMLRDAEESLTIEDDQNITINLNGKTITAKKTYVIKTYGELTIVNNSDNEGKILEISEGDIGYGIYNRDGKVTIKSGTVAAETSKENGRSYAIYNQSESPLNITGGSVIAEAKGTNSIGAGIYNLAGKEVKVIGGIVLGNAIAEGSTTYGIYNETEGKIEVTGGIVEGKASLSSTTSYGIYNEISQEVTISGGTIVGEANDGTAYGIYNDEGKVIAEEGIIRVAAKLGYGIYNNQGTIEQKATNIDMSGISIYGIDNEAGTLKVEGGNIELLGTIVYGIYNKSELNIIDGRINNRSKTSNTYGIYTESGDEFILTKLDINGSEYGLYNKSTNDIEISNLKTDNVTNGIYNNSGNRISITNADIENSTYGIFNQYGSITLNSAQIDAREGIHTSTYSNEVVVNSANITATEKGIANYFGTIKLKDATINSQDIGIFTTYSANTEIGEKGSGINTEKPNIYGRTNAIYMDLNQAGNIKYYDGVLQGKSVIYGGVSEIEDNSKIVIETIDNEGVEEQRAILQAIPETQVARIGENTYKTLQLAIEAVTQNQEETTTIEVLEDFDISSLVEIPLNKNVKLDLKGHTIVTYSRGGIVNKGTLEITDTTESTQGKITTNTGIGISNEGKFTLANGTIESNYYGIYNKKEFIINGGTVNAKEYGVYNIDSNNSVVMNNGMITASTGIYGGVNKVNNGTINGSSIGINARYGDTIINGGIIYGKNAGIRNNYNTLNIQAGTINSDYIGVENEHNGTINILDNTVINAPKAIYGYKGTVSISGGTITGGNNSADFALSISTGKAIVTGGTLKGYNGIINSEGTIVIGTKGGELLENTPTIIAEKYGIENNGVNTTLKYYDGKIEGKGKAVYGDINEVEDNKQIAINTEVIENKEYQVSSLVDEIMCSEPIAQIGETTFDRISTLKTAVKNIPVSTQEPVQVKILNNFNLLETLEILENQNVIIDLNGKTITSNSSIVNIGKLEITDSTESHLGKYINNNQNGIKNSGNLVIAKGTIEGAYYGIYNPNSEIEIGIKDENVNNELITIRGEYQAVSNSTKMYDGKLVGSNSCKNLIAETEEEYEVDEQYEIDNTTGKRYYITTLKEVVKEPIAQIGEQTYFNLQTAIDECQNGQTIVMLKTVDLKETINIPNEKNIILNLNYQTITSGEDITLINNGELSLIGGGTIENHEDGKIVIQNNGTLEVRHGGLSNFKKGTNARGTYLEGTSIENNGVLNVTGGFVSNVNNSYLNNTYGVINNGEMTVTNGEVRGNTAIENKGILTISGGSVIGNQYGVNNEGNATIEIAGGAIEGANVSIYNNSIQEINIAGGTIRSYGNSEYNTKSYGIYNNVDSNINITGGNIEVSSYNSEGNSYGIFNNSKGNILVSSESTNIKVGPNKEYGYGIYNISDGNVVFENGNITVGNCKYNATGIKNDGKGKVEVKGGTITAQSNEGTAYGIENSIFSELEITGGNITANTESGTSYGIHNISVKTVKIKEGNLKATGEQSYGIYSNTADIEIGDYNDEIKSTPIIEGENKGIYVNSTDTKLKFFDGKIIGKQAINLESTIPENAKIIRHYNEETQIETLLLMEKDTYIITFYSDEDKTQIIEQKLFKSTDTEIEEPAIPEREGYIGYWSDYEIGEHDIETWICYAIHRENGTKIISEPDEYGFRWNYTYWNGEAIEVYYESGDIEGHDGIVNIPARLDGYPVVSLYNSSGGVIYGRNIFVKQNNATNTTVKYVKIPSNVTYISEKAFRNCSGLTKIDIPNITNIGSGAFIGCTSLTEISIPRVTSIGSGAFSGCTNLTEIEMPNVTSIGESVFSNCTKLKIIKLPALTGSINSDKKYFYNCNNLEIVEIPNITRIGDSVFSGCSNLVEIDMPKVTSIGNSAFARCSSLTELDLPNVTSIGNSAFAGCSSLTELDLPNVTSIGKTAFSNCTNLIKVKLPILTQAIESDGYWRGIFDECNNLKIVEIPNVTRIGDYAFSGCTGLTNIEIPNVTRIGKLAFSGCTGLANIEIPNVTSIGELAFSGCTGLTNIEIPNVTSAISSDAFIGCSSIESIVVDSNNTVFDSRNNCNGIINTNDNALIVGCKNTIIPEGVTTIRGSAFKGNIGLTNIKILDNIKEIGGYAFQGCTRLTNIIIPSSVTSIGLYAFHGWTNEQTIYIEAESKPDGWDINWNNGCNANIVWDYKNK